MIKKIFIILVLLIGPSYIFASQFEAMIVDGGSEKVENSPHVRKLGEMIDGGIPVHPIEIARSGLQSNTHPTQSNQVNRRLDFSSAEVALRQFSGSHGESGFIANKKKEELVDTQKAEEQLQEKAMTAEKQLEESAKKIADLEKELDSELNNCMQVREQKIKGDL